jgi:hypothetical protein
MRPPATAGSAEPPCCVEPSPVCTPPTGTGVTWADVPVAGLVAERVAVDVAETVGELVADDVAAAVVVETGVAQTGRVIVLVSSVTAPSRASTRPEITAPVVTVTDVRARMLPVKEEFVPSVAELPTCQ